MARDRTAWRASCIASRECSSGADSVRSSSVRRDARTCWAIAALTGVPLSSRRTVAPISPTSSTARWRHAEMALRRLPLRRDNAATTSTMAATTTTPRTTAHHGNESPNPPELVDAVVVEAEVVVVGVVVVGAVVVEVVVTVVEVVVDAGVVVV